MQRSKWFHRWLNSVTFFEHFFSFQKFLFGTVFFRAIALIEFSMVKLWICNWKINFNISTTFCLKTLLRNHCRWFTRSTIELDLKIVKHIRRKYKFQVRFEVFMCFYKILYNSLVCLESCANLSLNVSIKQIFTLKMKISKNGDKFVWKRSQYFVRFHRISWNLRWADIFLEIKCKTIVFDTFAIYFI